MSEARPALVTFVDQIQAAFHHGLVPGACIVVLGNESLDLDSCVSTLVLALSLSHSQAKRIAVPVMNCRRADLYLRPDIVLVLKRAHILPLSLLFLDDFDETFWSGIGSVALVDHNRLSIRQQWLSPRVQMIFDHHHDEGGFPDASPRQIMKAASAATVVVLHGVMPAIPGSLTDRDLAFLVLAAIIADSDNFNSAMDRITDSDQQVLKQIAVATESIDCDELYNDILSARSNVDSITTADLLRRDLKVIETGSVRIPISVIPEPIASWCRRDPDWYQHVQEFCRENTSSLAFAVVLATYKGEENESKRQIAIIPDYIGMDLAQRFIENLLARTELGLELLYELSDDRASIFQQHHLQYTRKAFIPILQQWLLTELNVPRQETL